MADMQWPHTMTRGMFKGRHFENLNEYQTAIRAAAKAPGSSKARLVSGPDHHFKFILVDGTARMEVTGDPRSPSDVDKMLLVLAQFRSP